MSGMHSLKTNVRKGLLGATVSAVGAGVGGLIGGPIGMAVGGTLGGVIAATVFGKHNLIDFNWIYCFDRKLTQFVCSFCDFTDFHSAPEVIQNDFTPNERQDLLERGRRAVLNVKDLAIKMFLQLLDELRNCKSLEDFKHKILLPLLFDLVALGVTELIRLVWQLYFKHW